MKNLQLLANKELGIVLSDEQIKMFIVYYEELIEYNKITNLTRIVEEKEVQIKHFFDSLSIGKTIDLILIGTLCDLGTGAGFPGIPLKIVFPHLKVTLVDSLGKRIKFLEMIVEKLKLQDVKIINARAEEYALTHTQKFDVVVSRAFSKLRVFLEIGIPLLKKGGLLVAMKGNNYEDELVECKTILRKLDSSIIEKKHFELPESFGERTNIVVKKGNHVVGFPRVYSAILKGEVKL